MKWNNWDGISLCHVTRWLTVVWFVGGIRVLFFLKTWVVLVTYGRECCSPVFIMVYYGHVVDSD